MVPLFSAAIVEKTIFCCHGGLSPDLHDLDQVRFSFHIACLNQSNNYYTYALPPISAPFQSNKCPPSNVFLVITSSFVSNILLGLKKEISTLSQISALP